MMIHPHYSFLHQGYLQYSYLFYGFYHHETVLRGLLIAYHVPVAYVCVNLFLLVFCIFIILKVCSLF